MAEAVNEIPLADAPEAAQITDGRPYENAAGPVLAALQQLLAEEFAPSPGVMPSILKLTSLGCLASAVMDIFAAHVTELDSQYFWARSLARGRSRAHQRRKALRALKLSIEKAHDALPGARGSVCRGANRNIIQRRGTRRLASRVRGLFRRGSTRRVGV